MKKVVIIGGGFAGIYTAKELLGKADITLISKTNYFLFSPLLHEVAVGSVNRHNIVEPVRDILKDRNFQFYRAEVKKIDAKNNAVHFNSERMEYDYLVIAVGSKTRYLVQGAKEHTISLKTIRDSIDIRDRIIKALEAANMAENNGELRKHLTFSVVGAGPSGVELAGDLADLIKESIETRFPHISGHKPRLYLIQAEKNIIPILGRRCRSYAEEILKKKGITILKNTFVTEVEKEKITIDNERKIESGTIIWSGGIEPNHVKTIPRLQNKSGYFPVDEFMRVKEHKNIFSAGDCSYIEDNPVPALAQAAVKQAKTISRNICSSINNRPLEKFSFSNNGVIISLGQRMAVGEIYLFQNKKTLIKGPLAWFLKRHIYLLNLIGLQNKIRVGIEWFLGLIFPRDTSEI